MKLVYFGIITLLFISCKINNDKHNLNNKHKPVIGILPYRNIKQKIIDSVKYQLKSTYGFNVIILKSIDLPKSAYYTTRSRYRADSLLKFENKIIPDSISIIIGLTNKDISTTKKDKKNW